MPIKAEWSDFTDSNIKYLSLDDAGVYEIGKKVGNVVLYIGKSNSSIRSRLKLRKKETAFSKCTHFRFRRTKDADAAEKRLMDAYKKKFGKRPPLNQIDAPGDWRDKLL
jgi:hypothetical protein